MPMGAGLQGSTAKGLGWRVGRWQGMCASSNWPLHNTLVCCCAIQLLGVESISMQLYIIYFNNAVVIGLLDACCCQRLRDVACQHVRRTWSRWRSQALAE
jgi:hypothetical protein